MAAVASITITGTVAGGISGNKIIAPPVISNATSTDAIGVLALSSGFNSIAVPANAVGGILVPPASNAVTLTLKGVTGDTGVGLHLTNPTLISLAASQTTIGITTSSTVTLEVVWF